MPVNRENYLSIIKELKIAGATLVAVSKIRSPEEILQLYQLGQRDFGENYVQELVDKQAKLPQDIRWHFIGHLQTNKVKYIAPFIYMIQGVDSLKLLKEINKQALKCNRKINVLLQMHIAQEETKFGLDEDKLDEILKNEEDLLTGVNLCGLMGMASFTDNEEQVAQEFEHLKVTFAHYIQEHAKADQSQILSMGMSGDYRIALQKGSNMVRIGSLLFGQRGK